MPIEAQARRRWLIVSLLACALFINYVDRGALPTAAPLIQAEMHLDATQLGLLFSAFFWTYVCVQIPVGWLAEHYGAARVLTAGLLLWAAATFVTGFATSYALLFALRLLLGVGESVGFPCVSKLLAGNVPIKDLGVANGIVALGYLLGPAVGSYVGGTIMAAHGWRAAFLVFGAASLLWLVPWSRVRLYAAREQVGPGDVPTFSALLKQRALWGTSLGLFSTNFTFYFMLNWLPYYLVHERGFSTYDMGKFAGSSYIVNAVSALAAGWLTDRYIARRGNASFAYKSVLAFAHVGFVACMLVMAFGTRNWALGAIFAYQILCGLSSPGVYAVPQILAGPHAAGRWIGVQNSIGNLAGVIAPAVTGLIVDRTHHFYAAFILAAGVSLIGLVGWLGLLPVLAPIRWRTAMRHNAA